MRLPSLSLAFVFASPLASAAVFTWDGNGANNLLLEPVNWLGNNAPPDDGTADLVFTGSARTTPDLNGNFQIQSITFNSSASPFTINQIGGVGLKFEIGTGGISQDDGSTQTINTDITLAATQTWHANGGTLSIGSSGTLRAVNMNGNLVSLLTDPLRTINLHSRIYGSGNITKSGLGFLNLYNGSNSWSGTMTLNGGIVRLQGNDAFSASSGLNIGSTGRFDLNGFDTTALWLGGSGQIDLDGGELTVGDSSNRSYNGVIEGTGGKLIKQGSGTLTLTDTQITDGTEYWVQAGSLVVQGPLGTSPGLRINPGATMDVFTSSLTASALIGAGTLDLNGNDLNLTVGTGEVSFFNGTLEGSANADLTKFGDGKLILGEADTYTGQIRVNDGTLGFQGQNLFDNNAPLGDMIIESTGRMELDGTQQSFRLISGSGVIDLDGGELRLVGNGNSSSTQNLGLNIQGAGDLTFSEQNSGNDPASPDIDMSSSTLAFDGDIVIDRGYITGLGQRDLSNNKAQINSTGVLLVDNNKLLQVKTVTGSGTLAHYRSADTELLGDGQNYTFSGDWEIIDSTGSQTLEVHNQNWTFNGDILIAPSSGQTKILAGGDAVTNLRTQSNGDISIPERVEVESGGVVGFQLNTTSHSWTLDGTSAGTSGSASITTLNGATANVTIGSNFTGLLLTNGSSTSPIQLSTSSNTGFALTGSGDVELGGNLTLTSLGGTMDIDLRGHTLFLDINSPRNFDGRFVDSIGGGSVSVYGSDNLTLRGLSTFGGLLGIGTAGTTPGKVTIDTLNALTDDTSINLDDAASELDLLDHALSIYSLSGEGLVNGTTGSSLTLEASYFEGTFDGSVDLNLTQHYTRDTSHRLSGSGLLSSLTADTDNLAIWYSAIDVVGDALIEWHEDDEMGRMEMFLSTLRSTEGRISFTAVNPDFELWTSEESEAMEFRRSTIEAAERIRIYNEATSVRIDESSLVSGAPELEGKDTAISIYAAHDIDIFDSSLVSILNSSNQNHGHLNLLARQDLTLIDSTVTADTTLYLQHSNSYLDGDASLLRTMVTSSRLEAGDHDENHFSWTESSLSTTESEITGHWRIEASDLDFGSLTAEPGTSANFISGAISVDNDMSLGNGQFLGNQLTLTGLHELNVGGTLSVDRLALLTLARGDLTVGDMTVDGDFDWIAGDLTIGGAHSIGFSSFLGNDAALSTGQTLHVDSGLTVDYGGSLTLDGGTVLTRGAGNSLTNNGTLSQLRGPIRTDSFSNNFGATTFVGSLFTVENQAMQSASVTNAGTLEMTGPGSILQLQNGGKLSNEGLISGTGVIDGSIDNTASFSPGRIRADLGESLRITGNLNNDGAVELVGGSVEVQGSLTNTGDITGRGLLAGNRSNPTAIDNQGSMTFSGGTSDVYGNLVNSSGGTIISTGSGVVTFHDDFINNGTEMRTSEGSSSVFLGDVSGSGAFNGTGTVYFEGSFNPGNSPGLVTATVDVVMGPSLVSTFEIGGYGQGTEYDFVDAEGDLTLDGMLHVLLYGGFLPEAGDSFDLFDAPVITGSFDEVITDELPEGLEWDLSQLESDGIVSVQSTVTDPYDAWTAYWQLTGADAERSADPNGDGTSNLEHFAFDTNPISGGTEGRCRVEIADDGGQRYLTYTFPVRVGATFDAAPAATIDDFTYSVLGDDNLQGHDLTAVERSPLAAGMPALRDADADGFPDWEYRSFRLSLPVNVQARGFLQVSVVAAP